MLDDLLRTLESLAGDPPSSEPLAVPRIYTEAVARALVAKHKAQSIPINRASGTTTLTWDIDDQRLFGVVELVIESLNLICVLFTRQGADRWLGFGGATTIRAADVGAILSRVEPLAEEARAELAERARDSDS